MPLFLDVHNAGPGVTIEDVAKAHQADLATQGDYDVDYLRYQLRAPLEFDRTRNGFRYTEPAYRLPYFQLTEGELVALMLCERILAKYEGTPFEADLRRALRLGRATPRRRFGLLRFAFVGRSTRARAGAVRDLSPGGGVEHGTSPR